MAGQGNLIPRLGPSRAAIKMAIGKNLWNHVLTLVYPARCGLCGHSPADGICDSCLSSLPWIEKPVCRKCGRPCLWDVDDCRECSGRRFHFAEARALGLYQGSLREAVHQFKYNHVRAMGTALARLMVSQVEDSFFVVDFVSFVPSTRLKGVFRGYNQAEVLARGVATVANKPCRAVLKKTRSAQDQNTLKAGERRRNVDGAFSVMPGAQLEKRVVLLVDDVFTTGSTLDECSRVLRVAGAAQVKVLTAARSLPGF